MIKISTGVFQMGCDPAHNTLYGCSSWELPLHPVYLSTYFIDQHEVTNSQMAAFLNDRGNNNCDGYECVEINDLSWRISWDGGHYVVYAGYGNYPAVDVTWYGASVFCAESGKRLPSEAEWEKAARGDRVRTFPWGEDNPTCTLTNFGIGSPYSGCLDDTAPVGSYPTGASPYGVLDMSGNAWEWVNDWFLADYYSSSPTSNPPGPAAGTDKVQRGGGWISSWKGNGLRTANRFYRLPTYSDKFSGFRCVVGAAPGE